MQAEVFEQFLVMVVDPKKNNGNDPQNKISLCMLLSLKYSEK